MENVVPQEGEALSPIPDGEFWRPCYFSVYKYCVYIFCQLVSSVTKLYIYFLLLYVLEA